MLIELLWTIVQFVFGVPDAVTENLKIDAKAGSEGVEKEDTQTSYIFRGSIVFTLLVLLPMIKGAWIIAYHLWAAYHYHVWIWLLWRSWLWGFGFILFALAWRKVFHYPVRQYHLGVRELLGTTTYHNRSEPFSPERMILIPGQLFADIETAKDPGDPHAVLGDIKYVKKIRLPDGSMNEEVDSMRKFFRIKFKYKLDIHGQPKKVVTNYYPFFLEDYEQGRKKFTSVSRITDIVISTIGARMDEVSQKFFVEDLRMDNGKPSAGMEAANMKLFEHMQKVLYDIGILLVQISIDHIGDIKAGEYFEQINRQAAESQKAEADAQIAISRGRANTIEAEQRQAAEIARALADKEIAEKQKETVEVQLALQKLITEKDQQPLVFLIQQMSTDEGRKAAFMANFSRIVADNPEAVRALFTAFGYNNNNTILTGANDFVEALRTGGTKLLLDSIVTPAPSKPAPGPTTE